MFIEAAQYTLLSVAFLSGLSGSTGLHHYISTWALFHACEHFFTARFSARTASAHSFLLYGARGSSALLAVHGASIGEHLVARWLRGPSIGFPGAGWAVAVVGVGLRARAIYDCGDSFSHYIETETPRVLVTNGIYRWCRHPSYTGFLLYVVGMQLMLGNVVVYAASLVVLWRFFTTRIRLEEWYLVRMYPEYEAYRARVAAMIPYIY